MASRRPLGRIPVEAVVFAAALLARLGVIFRHGGLHGSFGYDAAVYFGAADALVHGRLPYRDFVLLHPPGLMVALTPFAALTRVMSDPSAFAVATVSFCVLGAVNAVLVVRVGRRLGLGRHAAAAGGLFYALWFGAVGAEYLTKLEPLGNLLFLLALLGVLRAENRGRMRSAVLAGVPLGLLVSVKIWWIVPALAVVGWYAWRTRSRRCCAGLLGGVGLAVAMIDLPFFLASPRAMFAGVVQDQLSRPPSSRSPLLRLGDISSVTALEHAASTTDLFVASAVLSALAVLLLRRAWTLRAARPVVVLLVGQLIVVLSAPSWFPFYADYLAVAAALTVAAAAVPRAGARRPGVGWIATATATAITVLTLAFGTSVVRPLPGATTLALAVSKVRCVISDSPMGQIELNALSRGLIHDCPNWIDVTGRTYGEDRAPTSRPLNSRWQRDLTAYLRSGGAIVIVRPGGTGITGASMAAIRKDGVLARADGQIVYRVVP